MTTKQIVEARAAVMRQVVHYLVEHSRTARDVLMACIPGATIVSLSQMVRNMYIRRSDLDDGAVAYEVDRAGLRMAGLVVDPPARQMSERYVPTERYTGAELQPYTGRPGANDAFTLPSRSFGRVHDRHGNPLKS